MNLPPEQIKRIAIEEGIYPPDEVSFYYKATSEKLQQFANRIAQMQREEYSKVLFDGYSVLQALTPKERARTSAENVSDVLDAVVRLIRNNTGE